MTAGKQWRSLPGGQTHPVLRWSSYVLCLIGILLLGYCGYVLLEARSYQAHQTSRFNEALNTSQPFAASGEHSPAPVLPALPEATLAAKSRAQPAAGGILLGRIELDRIGLDAMIMDGIDSKTLRSAVGHIPGTALPGQTGNVAIAGHRDTFFRGLRTVRLDDELTLTTLEGSYRYRVDSLLVVEPREIWVLNDTGEAILTLVSCYPFNYVGPAPQRFIVRAHRIPG
jgi:sortase A